jgi:predicted SnoaL-like aldol condensation-catalyzing enzyme
MKKSIKRISVLGLAVLAVSMGSVGIASATPSYAHSVEARSSAYTVTEQLNIDVTKKLYQEVFNEHKVQEFALKYLNEDYIQHNPAIATGRAAWIKGFTGFFAAIPDMSATINEIYADGDRVVVRDTTSGHTANGTAFKGEAVDVFRMENGKFAEHWDVVAGSGKVEQSGYLDLTGRYTPKELRNAAIAVDSLATEAHANAAKYSDVKFTLEQVLVHGDNVISFSHWTGTDSAGKHFYYRSADFLAITGGKVATQTTTASSALS